MGLTPHPLLMPKVLEKSRAIPLLTITACVAYKKRTKCYLIYDTLPMIKFRTFVIIVTIIFIIYSPFRFHSLNQFCFNNYSIIHALCYLT